jgi:hypothetical protein
MKLPSLPQIVYAFGILGFIYSMIVRRKRLATKEELTTHLESALAGMAIPLAAYLIACGFYPDLLAKIPGFQYYVGLGGMTALYFAIYKLVYVISPKKDDSSE